MKLDDLHAIERELDGYTTPQGEVQMTITERDALARKYKIDHTQVDGFARELAQQKGLLVLKESVRQRLGLSK